MPSLRVLHLENMAATSILPNFLQGIHKDLRKIRIVKCVALTESSTGEDQPSWGSLWTWIREAVPEPEEITCVLTKAPLTGEEADYTGGDVYIPPEWELVEVKRLRARLAMEEDFYVWPYAQVWKYGGISADEATNLQMLESEGDNLEYRLMLEGVENVGGTCEVVLC
ncbi:uncharacterized protein FTOL_00795 [Fusarium torulosum]|uniref:Uncharacterized protein n=1 Tax=Fusarium torulosum TaxID=33205 RepID=A0AAE8LYR5_9HYPO|nr:uncharacterized protein FTOL_00795 [Fusarium torulosum]